MMTSTPMIVLHGLAMRPVLLDIAEGLAHHVGPSTCDSLSLYDPDALGTLRAFVGMLREAVHNASAPSDEISAEQSRALMHYFDQQLDRILSAAEKPLLRPGEAAYWRAHQIELHAFDHWEIT